VSHSAPLDRPERSRFGRLRGKTFRGPVLLLVALITCLAVAVGIVTVNKVSDQMAGEADARLQRHADDDATALARLLASAASDLRLARRNTIFDTAITDTDGQLLLQDRAKVEAAIVYMGGRYAVDEMCLIRADGLETARWVGGLGVAPVDQLSPDELVNNPAVVPTLALGEDAVHETAPYVSPDSHRWVIGLGTPISPGNVTPRAVLHFEIPIQRLVDELADDPFGGSSYNLLLDRAGHLLSHPDLSAFRLSQGLGTNPNLSPFPLAAGSGTDSWRQAVGLMLGGEAGSAVFEEDGVSYRAAFAPEAGSDRIVATVSPLSELYADVDRARQNVAVTVGPLVLLMVLVSALFALRLSGNNRRLAQVNRRLGEVSLASADLAAIVRSGDDAMLSVGLDGAISTWNDGATRMYGRSPASAIGSPVSELFQPDHRAFVPSLLASVGSGEPIQRQESMHVGADGDPLAVSLTMSPIRNETGDVTRAALVVRDVSDRKRLEEELAHQALHDALTGLPNRVLFHDRLVHSLARARRPLGPMGTHHAVLFVDLDNFKLINDTFGHRMGDELLVSVAGRITECLRGADTAARLGGDEFTILLENVEESRARLVADRLLERLHEPFDLDGHQIVVSASIGIALSEASTDVPDDLMRSADTAMYEAKSNGKGRHETYHPQMNARVWRRMELETDIRRALANREFVVHYQPILELSSRRIRSVEALVRWQHPDQGLVAPGEFISTAEQTGLIVELGAFVLRAACANLATWSKAFRSARDLGMSVNVSVRELREPDYVESVRAILEEHGLDPRRLTLEITETVILEPEGPGAAALMQLRGLGVTVCIDDFGAGYSSLGYFRRLPAQAMKIDRAFIGGLGIRPEDTAIVAAAMAFANALGVEVTAEGVETTEQIDELLALNCGLAQGFYFCPPRDAASIEAILRQGRFLRQGLVRVPQPDAA
jgi:diguanylate cyclase (GGDEF)-like protein/PAS domain S-box-containing protein